jgi:hypothetical protein
MVSADAKSSSISPFITKRGKSHRLRKCVRQHGAFAASVSVTHYFQAAASRRYLTIAQLPGGVFVAFVIVPAA